MFPALVLQWGKTTAAAPGANFGDIVQSLQSISGSGTATAPSAVINPLLGGTISSNSYDDAGNSSSVTFNADGTISASTDGLYAADNITGQEWYDGTPDTTYEIKATLNAESGTGTKSGTFGSWLSFPQTWGAAKLAGNGSKRIEFTVQIRRASDGNVMSNGTNDYIAIATNSTGPEM